MNNEVINFINVFTNNGKRTEVIECFTSGCCYWFAYILDKRFNSTSKIVHDPINGHFACIIGNRIYDITGDITDQDRKWDLWSDFEIFEPKVAQNIMNTSAYFTE